MNMLSLIGRDSELFEDDIKTHEKELSKIVPTINMDEVDLVCDSLIKGLKI